MERLRTIRNSMESQSSRFLRIARGRFGLGDYIARTQGCAASKTTKCIAMGPIETSEIQSSHWMRTRPATFGYELPPDYGAGAQGPLNSPPTRVQQPQRQ